MAPQARTFSFVISGSSNDAVDALRKLADAGKNTGGELGKAGRALEKALGDGVDGIAKSPAAAKVGDEIGDTLGSRASKAFGEQLRSSLGDTLANAIPGDFLGGVTEQLGGAEAAVAGLSTAALGAAAAFAVAGAAYAAFLTAGVNTYTELVTEAERFGQLAGLSMEQAIPFVDTLRRLGIETTDAESSLIQLSTQLKGNTLKELQGYGVTVAKAADGTTDLVGTLLNVVDAYQKLPAGDARNRLAALAFGEDDIKNLAPLLRLTREELQGLLDTAIQGTDADAEANRRWQQQTAELSQSFRELKFEAGRTIIPALTVVVDRLNSIADSKAAQIISGILVGGSSLIGDRFAGAADDIEVMGMASEFASGGIRNLNNETEKAAKKAYDLGDAYASAAERLGASAQAFRTFTADERASISTATGLQNAWAELDDALASRTATSGRAAEAITSLAEAEAEAAESVAKARADAAESLADVERQAADRIADAQDRVTEARERATRAAEDATRRLRDARQALQDAVVRSAGEDNPFEAQRLREQAAQDLADAEVDAARSQEDARKGVADAEQDLADTVVEAARDRERAQRDAAERVADAEEAAADRVQAAQKAVQDAVATTTAKQQDYSSSLQDVVDRTFDAAYWAREHGASQEEVQAIIDTSRAKVQTFAEAMGLSADETEELIRQLGLIPSQVELNFVARLNLDEFNAKLVEASRSFGDAASAAAVASGAALGDVGGATPVPRFAEGGLFRTPGAPGGAGLAVLHDGERVLTPQQQAGSGATIVVQGSVITERELADVIIRLKRDGYL